MDRPYEIKIKSIIYLVSRGLIVILFTYWKMHYIFTYKLEKKIWCENAYCII